MPEIQNAQADSHKAIMAAPTDKMSTQELGRLAQNWATRASELAHQAAGDSAQLLELINPSRIQAGAPRGSNKAGANLARTARDLRQALKTWSYLAKKLKERS